MPAGADVRAAPAQMVSGVVRRAADILVATAGLVVAAPVLVVAAVAVVATTGRPVLFADERAGRDGHPFRLLKLRTMRALRPGETVPASDGARITKVGRLLRSTSIDELPSLLNVLRGDMALVGPRPLPVRYVARYTDDQRRRLEVRPGLTGWAQVNGRNATGWDARLAHDVWYVEHRSLRLDGRILAATVRVVLGRGGISATGEATMPELPERSP
ncbi:MAG: sugar transferase [Ilumatobacteraceae bacterium]